MTDARVAQAKLKVLAHPPPADGRVAQAKLQVLSRQNAALTEAWVAQVKLKVLAPNPDPSMPPSGPTLYWWDGATLASVASVGWWDGSAIQPLS